MVGGDTEISRRVFITLALSGGACAVAGCSGDGGSDSEEADATQTPAAGSTESPTPTATDTRTETGEGSQDNLENPESENEVNYEETFVEDGFQFIELENKNNVELEDKYLNTAFAELKRKGSSLYQEQGFLEYEHLKEFVGAYMLGKTLPDFGMESASILLGFRDVERSEDISEPYRDMLISVDHGESEEETFYPAMTPTRFQEGALERFLQENLHGYADHSKGVEQELLEYASQ